MNACFPDPVDTAGDIKHAVQRIKRTNGSPADYFSHVRGLAQHRRPCLNSFGSFCRGTHTHSETEDIKSKVSYTFTDVPRLKVFNRRSQGDQVEHKLASFFVRRHFTFKRG